MLELPHDRLFVVDKDPHVRHLVQLFLEDTYVLEFFDDGYAALDRVRSSPPALLMTEVLVPHLDGLALCRLLKADPVTRDVPILVFSMVSAADRAHESGADGFLEKPLERNRLRASVLEVTSIRNRVGGPAAQNPGAA